MDCEVITFNNYILSFFSSLEPSTVYSLHLVFLVNTDEILNSPF